MIARVNRALHYEDMIFFKNLGFKCYDFGGIAYQTKDKDKSGINAFKMAFCDNIVCEYQGNIPVTLKGKLAILLHKILRFIKK